MSLIVKVNKFAQRQAKQMTICTKIRAAKEQTQVTKLSKAEHVSRWRSTGEGGGDTKMAARIKLGYGRSGRE